MNTNQKRIFVSYRECKNKIHPLSPIGVEFLNRLAEEGFTLIREKEPYSYEVVFDDIESSDAYLALIDEWWFGGTYTFVEFCFARGRTALPSDGLESEWRPIINPHPVPIFFYLLPSIFLDRAFDNNPNVLDADIERAVSQLKKALLEN